MKKNGFVEGAIIATIAVIVTKILGMLYVIPFYKIIGSQGGALYSYAYNIYNIFLCISSAGIPTAISKIISEYNTLDMKEAKYRTFLLGKKIIGYLSVAAFLIMFLFADFIAAAIIGDMTGGNTVTDVGFVIRCISFAVLVIPYLSVTKGYIQGHSIVTPTSIGGIIEQVIRIFVILSGSFLAYKVFDSSLTLAVGIAVSGAFFGGLAACIYLRKQMNKHKKELDIAKFTKKDNISNKEIIQKIIKYAVPFIIVSIASSIYTFTDMVLIIRGLNMLGYSADVVEFVQSAITTWGTKICMIISSFAMGMSVSLIPNMVSSFVKKDWKDVNLKLNRAYQIILVVSIPCAIGLCVLAKPVWTIFYGFSTIGPLILEIMLVAQIIGNLYSITFNTMQSLNKFKIVYISVVAGFTINAALDVPLILLCNYIGLPAYWGATIATIIGYVVSIKIATHNLKKEHNFSFKSTYVMTVKILVPGISMLLVLVLFNSLFKFDCLSSFNCLLMILSNTVIGAAVYIGIGLKTGTFEKIFGKAYLNKIIKKLTFNKVSIKN